MRDEAALRILVVEDEFLIATDIAAILEEAGHRVLGPVGSINSAETILARERPDMAVIDANLGGKPSSSLASKLSDMDVPFCICTGYTSADLETAFGLVVTVQKPVNSRKLLDAIGALRDRR